MTGIVIQARMGSTRLSGKVLMPIGKKKLLEHILDRLNILRAENCKVVVATTLQEKDDPIVRFCRERGVACFRGSENNVLERYWMCAQQYGFEDVVRLTADNPFTDMEEVERLIAMHRANEADYSYSYTELPVGVGIEILSRSALERCMQLAYKENHFEHVDDYIVEHMDQFHCYKLSIAPEKIHPEVRLTVDTVEDYKRACYIAEHASQGIFSTTEAIRLAQEWESAPCYALCLESSHERGMGHLFRGINLYRYLERQSERSVVMINGDLHAIEVLTRNRVPYEVIDYADVHSNWETLLIRKYHVKVWLNDKLQTDRRLYEHVKENPSVVLCAIDEESDSADLLDIHFASTIFRSDLVPGGKKIYRGTEYLVLNEEIRKYQRIRTRADRVIVSLGGSDTYGVTVKVLNILKQKYIKADIVTGPSFEHKKELEEELTEDYHVYHDVPSLIEKFSEYDVAITGGGMTCLEAAALGIPCIIVASEDFEIITAQYMENIGCAVFAGFHEEIDAEKFDIAQLEIEEMSRAALNHVTLDGAEHIYGKIQEYLQNMGGTSNG